MDPDLTLEHLNERLDAYGRSSEITAHLFYLGEIQINEVIARTGQIEAKAMTALGFSVAGLAFLLFQSTSATSLLVGSCRTIGGIVLFVGGLNAYRALELRTWRWISDATWFPPADLLVDDEAIQLIQIRQSHVRELFEIRHQMHAANEQKARSLRWAVWLLIVAGGWLLAGVILELFV